MEDSWKLGTEEPEGIPAPIYPEGNDNPAPGPEDIQKEQTTVEKIAPLSPDNSVLAILKRNGELIVQQNGNRVTLTADECKRLVTVISQTHSSPEYTTATPAKAQQTYACATSRRQLTIVGGTTHDDA